MRALLIAIVLTALIAACSGGAAGRAGSATPVTPQEDWAVQLRAGSDAQAVARRHAATVVGPIAQVPDLWQFRLPATNLAALRTDPSVVWAEPVRPDINVPRVQ